MDLFQAFLNLVIPILGFCTLLVLWPALTVRSMFLRTFHAIFPENVRGKVVLITGASSGIGEQTAYEYAKRGAILVLIARREDKLRSVANNCIKLGAMDVHAIRADASKEDDCRRFIEDTVNQYGRLDHLVNNVGVMQSFLFEDAVDTTPMTQIWGTNFWGYIYPTLYAIPHLQRSKGRIVAIASVDSWLPHPRASIYNASKAAILNFFDTLRIELGPSIGGITIVTPLYIESEMLMGKYMSGQGKMEYWQEDNRDVQIGPGPVSYAEECGRAIVKGALKGARYVRVPAWSAMLLVYRVFAPELVDLVLTLFYMIPVPGRKDRAPLSKALLEIPGLKALLFPPTIRNMRA